MRVKTYTAERNDRNGIIVIVTVCSIVSVDFFLY